MAQRNVSIEKTRTQTIKLTASWEYGSNGNKRLLAIVLTDSNDWNETPGIRILFQCVCEMDITFGFLHSAHMLITHKLKWLISIL